MTKLTKSTLEKLYTNKGFSVAKIAKKFNASQTGVNYWLSKYHISKRSI